MKNVLLLVTLCLAGSACRSPAPPVPAKALTDDEFLATLSAQHKSSPAPLLADYTAAGAVDVCQQFVRDRLKAPASAKFPSAAPDLTTMPLGGGRFRVTAYVDSQNGFGALIRNTTDCAVHWVKGTDWALDHLELRGR